MEIDAGGDQIAGRDQPVKFRAFFKPPEGIDRFSFVWDFGDGSGAFYSDRTAPTADADTRVTAPVTHVYYDVENSPYFAEITITGTGDSGVAEAKASVVVTVSEIPVITVFAGTEKTVEEGEEAEFSGSFTRPEGVSDLKFTWTFGDGSATVSGDVGVGRYHRRRHASVRELPPRPLHRDSYGHWQDRRRRHRGLGQNKRFRHRKGEPGDRRLERRRDRPDRYPGAVRGRRGPRSSGNLGRHLQPGLDRGSSRRFLRQAADAEVTASAGSAPQSIARQFTSPAPRIRPAPVASSRNSRAASRALIVIPAKAGIQWHVSFRGPPRNLAFRCPSQDCPSPKPGFFAGAQNDRGRGGSRTAPTVSVYGWIGVRGRCIGLAFVVPAPLPVP